MVNHLGSAIKTVSLVVAVVAAIIAAPAQAHHSRAMFDLDTELELRGTVISLEWTNPHSWLHVMIEDEEGGAVHWAFEMVAIGGLARVGMRPNTVLPGDVITLRTHPLKDGGTGGELLSITLPDGMEMPVSRSKVSNQQ